MTRKSLEEHIKRLYALHKGKADKTVTDAIGGAIVAGYEDFWNSYHWAFKEMHDTLTTTADQETVDLPDDFEGIVSVVERTSDKGRKLSKMTPEEYDRLLPYSGDYTHSTPEYYKVYYDRADDLWKLALYPTPDSAISLYITYHILEDNTDPPNKFVAALMPAVWKYMFIPGSPEYQAAHNSFIIEVERLKMTDDPNREGVSRFLTENEAAPERKDKWYDPWN